MVDNFSWLFVLVFCATCSCSSLNGPQKRAECGQEVHLIDLESRLLFSQAARQSGASVIYSSLTPTCYIRRQTKAKRCYRYVFKVCSLLKTAPVNLDIIFSHSEFLFKVFTDRNQWLLMEFFQTTRRISYKSTRQISSDACLSYSSADEFAWCNAIE